MNEIAESPDSFADSVSSVISDLLSTGPMAVSESKKLTMEFDRWTGSDEELRIWTMDKTSEMRGSLEGQEGLSAFLDRRLPNWSPNDED